MPSTIDNPILRGPDKLPGNPNLPAGLSESAFEPQDRRELRSSGSALDTADKHADIDRQVAREEAEVREVEILHANVLASLPDGCELELSKTITVGGILDRHRAWHVVVTIYVGGEPKCRIASGPCAFQAAFAAVREFPQFAGWVPSKMNIDL